MSVINKDDKNRERTSKTSFLDSNKKLLTVIIVVIIAVVSAIILLISTLISTDSDTLPANSDIAKINLSEIEDIINGKVMKPLYIYIGRDSCPSCTTLYPSLEKVVRQYNLNLMYYSTEPDRYDAKEQMNTVLELIQVSEVPAIVYFDEGRFIETLSGEDFVKQYPVEVQ